MKNEWKISHYTVTQQEGENITFPVSEWEIKDDRDYSCIDIEFYTPQFRKWIWGKNKGSSFTEYLLGWATICFQKNRNRPKRIWEN